MFEKKISRKDALKFSAMAGVAGFGLTAVSGELLAGPCAAPAAGDKETRNQFKYVDKSTTAGQTCANCVQFTAAGSCGTCVIVKGPIAPAGWCTVWAKKA